MRTAESIQNRHRGLVTNHPHQILSLFPPARVKALVNPIKLLIDTIFKPVPKRRQPLALEELHHGLMAEIINAVACLHGTAWVRHVAATRIVFIKQTQRLFRETKGVSKGELDERDRRARRRGLEECFDILGAAHGVELLREDLDADRVRGLEEVAASIGVRDVQNLKSRHPVLKGLALSVLAFLTFGPTQRLAASTSTTQADFLAAGRSREMSRGQDPWKRRSCHGPHSSRVW